MKAFVFAIWDMLFPVIVAAIPEDLFKEWFTEWLAAWAAKHLTPEELIGEERDFCRWFRKKVLGK